MVTFTTAEVENARAIADKVLAGNAGNHSSEALWWAYGVLDATIMGPREEKADYARKAAVLKLYGARAAASSEGSCSCTNPHCQV